MNEEKLDELLELDDFEIDQEIKKKINGTLFKRFLFLFSIFGLTIALLIGVVFLHKKIKEKEYAKWETEQNYYDPITETGEELFNTLMSTALELRFPNITFFDGNLTKTDTYEYEWKVQTTPIIKYYHYVVGAYNTTISINRSEITDIQQSEHPYITFYMNMFFSPNQNIENGFYSTFDDNLIDEIKALPDSCVLSAYINFNDYYSTSQIVNMIDSYPKSLFTWLATDSDGRYSQAAYDVHDGVLIYKNSFADIERELSKTYKDFYFSSNDINKEKIENSYFSQIQFLLDHEEFLRLSSEVLFTKEQLLHKLNQANQMIQENGELQFIGMYGVFRKDDLLDLIEKYNFTYGSVQDVKLSILQK